MHDATRKTISMVREKIKAVSDTYQELMTTCQQKRNLFIVCVRFHMNMRQVGPIYMNLCVCIVGVHAHTNTCTTHSVQSYTHAHNSHTRIHTMHTPHTCTHTHHTHAHTPYTHTHTHTHTHTTHRTPLTHSLSSGIKRY